MTRSATIGLAVALVLGAALLVAVIQDMRAKARAVACAEEADKLFPELEYVSGATAAERRVVLRAMEMHAGFIKACLQGVE